MSWRIGHHAMIARRVTGWMLGIYFLSYCALVAAHGGMVMLGELGRLGRAFRWLEIGAIGVMSFHACEGIAQWVVQRGGWARHHRLALAFAVAIAVLVTAVHVPLLFGPEAATGGKGP